MRHALATAAAALALSFCWVAPAVASQDGSTQPHSHAGPNSGGGTLNPTTITVTTLTVTGLLTGTFSFTTMTVTGPASFSSVTVFGITGLPVSTFSANGQLSVSTYGIVLPNNTSITAADNTGVNTNLVNFSPNNQYIFGGGTASHGFEFSANNVNLLFSTSGVLSSADGNSGGVNISTLTVLGDAVIRENASVATLTIKNTRPSGQGNAVLALDRAVAGNSDYISYLFNGVSEWSLGTGISAVDADFKIREEVSGTNIVTLIQSGAVSNTLYLKTGNVGVDNGAPVWPLDVQGVVHASSAVVTGSTGAYQGDAGGMAFYARSNDGATQSSGCVVIVNMSGNVLNGFSQFTSTTTSGFNFVSNQAVAGVLLETCAPGAFCRVGLYGPFFVSTPAALTNVDYVTTSTSRCQVADDATFDGTVAAYKISSCAAGGGCWIRLR